MGSMNHVILMGNLTRDPELRKTPSGISVADLRLATSETYRKKDGETAESVCYTDIVVWAKQAENCDQYLAKGDQVLVEGRLQLDQWKTETGDSRSRLRVRAHRVQFLRTNGGNGSTAQSASARARRPHDNEDTPF
jgi:single-strand DNA-binding protein